MKKRFDNGKTNKASVIDCLECENYYTSACDGNAGGCNAYKPTRKVTMEKDIRYIKALCLSNWIMTSAFALSFIIFCIRLIIASL
jgi:hypothetical protein